MGIIQNLSKLDTLAGCTTPGCYNERLELVKEIPGVLKSFDFTYFNDMSTEEKESVIKVILPDDLEEVGYGTFMDFTNLRQVTLGANLERIRENAFTNCKLLKEVYLPGNLEYIGEYAFSDSGIISIVLPESVKDVRRGAFSHCNNLQIVCWCGKSDVPHECFKGCDQLFRVSFNHLVKGIESEAFIDCTSLRFVDFPRDLSYIGWAAFRNCTALEEVDLCKIAIKDIHPYSFCGCSNLLKMKFDPWATTKIDDYALEHCNNLDKSVLFGKQLRLNAHAFG